MSQKVSKEAKVGKNVSDGIGKQLQIIFGRLHNLYEQNNKLWTEIMILQKENNKLRNASK